MPFFNTKVENGAKQYLDPTTTEQSIATRPGSESLKQEDSLAFCDSRSTSSNQSSQSTASKVANKAKRFLFGGKPRHTALNHAPASPTSSTVTVTASVPGRQGSLEVNATWREATEPDVSGPYSSRNPSFSRTDYEDKARFHAAHASGNPQQLQPSQKVQVRLARYSYPFTAQEQYAQNQLNQHYPVQFDTGSAEQLPQFAQHIPTSQNYNTTSSPPYFPPRPPPLHQHSSSQSILQSSQSIQSRGSFLELTVAATDGITDKESLISQPPQIASNPIRPLKKTRTSKKKKKAKRSKSGSMSATGEASRGYASTKTFIEAFQRHSTDPQTGEYTLGVIREANFFRYVRDHYDSRLDPKRYRRVIRQVVAPQQGYKVGSLEPGLERLLRNEFEKLGKKKWNFVNCLTRDELEGKARVAANPVPAFDLMMIESHPHDSFAHYGHVSPRHSHHLSNGAVGSSSRMHKRQKSMELEVMGENGESMFYTPDLHMAMPHAPMGYGQMYPAHESDVVAEAAWYAEAAMREQSASPRRKSRSQREAYDTDLGTRSPARRDKDRLTRKSSKSGKSSKSAKKDKESGSRHSSKSSERSSRSRRSRGSGEGEHHRSRHRLGESYNYEQQYLEAPGAMNWQRQNSQRNFEGELYGMELLDEDFESVSSRRHR